MEGESLRDKREVLGREKGTFGFWRKERRRNQRENSKKREKSRDLSLESLDSLK